MELVLSGLPLEYYLLYLDDILVAALSVAIEIERLDAVFHTLLVAGLKLSPKKTHLVQLCVKFLGHMVSERDIAPDPEKISAVMEWETPKCLQEAQSFNGLCGYYRQFISNYSDIANPIQKLAEKDANFLWDTNCQAAFEKLKLCLTTAPILACPTVTDSFILDTDASNYSVDSVLSQVQFWGRESHCILQ